MDDLKNKSYMNPYLAGIALGLVLLASFLTLGVGLGASSGLARVGASLELCLAKSHTLSSEYFGSWGEHPMQYYLVYMFIGVFAGALFSALLAGRMGLWLERGAACSAKQRIWLALGGGVLVGFASRLAAGCTSGQALTGTAQLMTGSIVFLICVFVGGYAMAYVVRRQWHD